MRFSKLFKKAGGGDLNISEEQRGNPSKAKTEKEVEATPQTEARSLEYARWWKYFQQIKNARALLGPQCIAEVAPSPMAEVGMGTAE